MTRRIAYILSIGLSLGVLGAALGACSPGAVGFIKQEVQQVQSQSSPSAIDATPTPDASQATDAPAEGIIQVLIQRGNFQQEQAITSHDPSSMKESATDSYFKEMAQTNQDLLDNNVTSIKLVALEWGQILVRGNVALATTYETWSTTFSDGKTTQTRDRNDYRVVRQNGTWKIDSDSHPDESPLPAGSHQT